MTSPLIEAIKKDQENWTWTKAHANELGAYAGHTEGFVEVSDRDARRIARVPDLEEAVLAAEKLAEVAMWTGCSTQTDADTLFEAITAFRKTTEKVSV